ncbi:hypothetical protein BH09ACT8_BH09ACT8_30950 [soil metagenome]
MSTRSDLLGTLTVALFSASVTTACIGLQQLPPPVAPAITTSLDFQAYTEGISGHGPAPAGGVNPLLVPYQAVVK